MNIQELSNLAMTLFEKKFPLNMLHQEIAENFYPQRADFTVRRSLSEDFASELITSWPLICHRDLSNTIGQMLRQKSKPWFHVARKHVDPENEDTETKQALQWFEKVMRKALYDKDARFNVAATQADYDFSAFGQFAMSIELNSNADALLFRTWHLKNMAWKENENGAVGFKTRKWKPDLFTIKKTFGKDRLHANMQKDCDDHPFDEQEILHIVCDTEMYDKENRYARWSIWYDPKNKHIISEVPTDRNIYIIPRWQIIGSQYAYSPAVIAALPDARLIQAMTWTLLEVGEKAANPPMLATRDAIRGDMALYAGGVTWADRDYDQRTGDALRPITQDFRGLPHGVDMAQETKAMIKEAFFLNKLAPFNPAQDPEMTAYQAGQYIQEYVRNALPIFSPMESEYNAALCEEVFTIMASHGAFGAPSSWPRTLQGAETEFQFESPLHDIMDKEKTTKWLEAKAILAEAIATDPSTRHIIDAPTALRDALHGAGVPANWLNTEEEAKKLIEDEQQAMEAAQLMESLKTGSEAASNLANAEEQLG